MIDTVLHDAEARTDHEGYTRTRESWKELDDSSSPVLRLVEVLLDCETDLWSVWIVLPSYEAAN